MSTTPPPTTIYYTTCPSCKTRFKINESQLQARQGQVRCGACGQVFNANTTLEKPSQAPKSTAKVASSPRPQTPPVTKPTLVPTPVRQEEPAATTPQEEAPPVPSPPRPPEEQKKRAPDLDATLERKPVKPNQKAHLQSVSSLTAEKTKEEAATKPESPPPRAYRGFASAFAEEQKTWGDNPPPLESTDLSKAFGMNSVNTGEFDFDGILNQLRADKLASKKEEEPPLPVKKPKEEEEAALKITPKRPETAANDTPPPVRQEPPTDFSKMGENIIPLKKPSVSVEKKSESTPEREKPLEPNTEAPLSDPKKDEKLLDSDTIVLPKRNTLPKSIQEDDLFSTIEFEAIPIEGQDDSESDLDEDKSVPDLDDSLFETSGETKPEPSLPASDFKLDFDDAGEHKADTKPLPINDGPDVEFETNSPGSLETETVSLTKTPEGASSDSEAPPPIVPIPEPALASPAPQSDPFVFVSAHDMEKPLVDPKQKLWRILSAISAVILFIQLGFFFRMDLINVYPGMKPFFEGACGVLGCDMSPPRALEQLSVVGSDMEQAHVNATDMVTLHITIANHATYPVAFPSVIVELTNPQGQVIGRRFVNPTEYLTDEKIRKRGVQGKQDIQIQIHLKLNQLQAFGYHIEFFYPL